jgi:23S rRNA (guanosine2251-2'-O)-methyltransferase
MAPAAGKGDGADVIYGLHAVREALRSGARPIQKILLVGQERQYGELYQQARTQGIPVRVEPRTALDRLVPEGRHQGVVALVAAKEYVEPEAILDAARRKAEAPFVLLLDGVEDPHNLGAVLRTADGAGVHGVVIPERRSAGLTGAVARASAGAVDHVPVSCVTNLIRQIEQFQKDGLWVYAVDPAAEKPYTALDYRGAIGLVLGGEGEGVRKGVLAQCDDRIRIPMRGQVASLNVSVAAAVLCYEVVRQRSQATD